MRISLVRPPTFAPNVKTYPYNLECITMALKKDDHDISWVDGELMSAQLIEDFKKQIDLDRSLLTSKYNSIKKKFLSFHIISKEINKSIDTLLDSIFNDMQSAIWHDIVSEIISQKPEAICFSCYSSSMSSTYMITKLIRGHYHVNVPIILGGVHPSSVPADVLKQIEEVDYIVVGEGEVTIRELIKALEKKCGNVDKIKGIYYKKNGEIHKTEARDLLIELGQLPVPTFGHTNHSYTSYVIMTSRGCPYNCHFCATNVLWKRSVRYRPAENVVREIINLKTKTNIKYIRFGDDTFTLNKNHILSISERLIEAKINDINFSIGSRVDSLDYEKLKILKKMGVSYITFGIESGSARILKQNEKKINIHDAIPTIQTANKMGINTHTYFILNHPGEKLKDMRATITLIRKLNKACPSNTTELNIGFPYPATQWWDYCERNGLVSGIDFYRFSHKYNHQQMPAVNMTEESKEMLLKTKKVIEYIEIIQSVKIKIKKIFQNLFNGIVGNKKVN